MKSLAEQMHDFDREQMSRVANNLPEQYQERAPVEQVAQVFNGLFNQLRAAFPASMANFRTQEDLNEFRRQWLLAFQENGIHSMAQVDAGMRIARRQERPFLPSPGQFVAWCKQEMRPFGVSVDDVMAEFKQWQRLVFKYTSSEKYPWSQPVMYHICLELRRRSTDGQLSEKELKVVACEVLAYWEKRVDEGHPVPPVRRALASPKTEQGPTPAQLLKAKYDRMKNNGMV
ncbi:TPA: phage replication protein [Citrobacter freundii]|uniref:replication protein P n=2 Tax=Enterobacteriaceae TaxID=543 RepID=UPI0024469A03|nr:replication protein P [Citrobacter freundii]MDH1000971.1 replication protein P [Citrobacter freundii]HBN5582653.1 phage replication protein [Citrobacter freundii]HBN5638755.1 phage replication protein [Citrobacter freundii]HBN5672992.1 phage replication protein [Citrobacter freundii]HBV0650709.1 phage replication protein [Citrobacter freundii]